MLTIGRLFYKKRPRDVLLRDNLRYLFIIGVNRLNRFIKKGSFFNINK